MHDLGLIVLMAAVSYATRVVGFVATGWMGKSSSVVKWADRLGNLVLVVILARILWDASVTIWVGVGVAVAAMILSSRFLLSMWLGVAIVAAARLGG